MEAAPPETRLSRSSITAGAICLAFLAGYLIGNVFPWRSPAAPQTAGQADPSSKAAEPPQANGPAGYIDITFPDGVRARVPAGTPITRELTHTGGSSFFDAQGAAVSPSLTTSAEGVAGQFKGESGTPILATPPGSQRPNEAKSGGGGISFKAGPTQNMLLQIFGAVVMLAGISAPVWGRKFSFAMSLTESLGVVGIGALIVCLGRMEPEWAPIIVLAAAGMAAGVAVLYVMRQRSAAKAKAAIETSAKATGAKLDRTRRSAGIFVKVVDDLDDGTTDGVGNPLSAGGKIKREVKKRGELAGEDIEATIDEIIKAFNA